MRNTLIQAHSALMAVNIIYGANYVIAKGVMSEEVIAVSHLTPAGFVMTRIFGAVILFWILHRFMGIEKVARTDLARLAFCGLFGVALNQMFFFEGLARTSPIDASIIMMTTPVTVVLLSFVILKERPSWKRVLGVAVGLGGAIGLILQSTQSGGKASDPEGNLFILINALSYASYLVLVKPLMTKYKPVTVISYAFLFGALFAMPRGMGSFTEVNWDLPSMVLWKIAFVVVCTTFIAYLLNIFALKIVSPTVSSSYIYLQPVLSLFFVWVDDRISGGSALGVLSIFHLIFGLLVCLGVFLVSRR